MENSNDLISRQAAIKALGETSDELYENIKKGATFPQRQWFDGMAYAESILRDLPSAQSEQTKMIKEIRKWINSENRGSADYFIVDKIEEIINKYE